MATACQAWAHRRATCLPQHANDDHHPPTPRARPATQPRDGRGDPRRGGGADRRSRRRSRNHARAIAERAGVAHPSLYRFFADREEILDRLIERHLAELEALSDSAERTWEIASVADLVRHELELHINYYRQHPSAARLWIGGRTSPTVTRQVRARIRVLADRMRNTVINAGLVPAHTDPLVFLMTVELGDRILDLAFRDSDVPEPAIIELGRTALDAYIERMFPAKS
jgi:AcrR family transcriptional regulator